VSSLNEFVQIQGHGDSGQQVGLEVDGNFSSDPPSINRLPPSALSVFDYSGKTTRNLCQSAHSPGSNGIYVICRVRAQDGSPLPNSA